MKARMNHDRPPIEVADLEDALDALHARYTDFREGALPAYIPELAKADPDGFAIAACTVDGQLVTVGDANHLFTVQSISKPFVYGLALEDRGRDFVHSRVGVEPTGDTFNAIVLDERSKRPHNPMVNAGAIAVTSFVQGDGPIDRLNRILAMFARHVGHKVNVDMSIYMSERTTGHRNRAMAHLMLNFGMIEPRVEEILDLYFQQCAALVDCRDLAVMAGTLANRGVNPLTGERAVQEGTVRDILSVMYTCGLYEYSGEWLFRVGLPAKSGVGGGIMAVIPGQMGIAVYSPLLDERGNSARGIQVFQDLSERFRLHVFDHHG